MHFTILGAKKGISLMITQPSPKYSGLLQYRYYMAYVRSKERRSANIGESDSNRALGVYHNTAI